MHNQSNIDTKRYVSSMSHFNEQLIFNPAALGSVAIPPKAQIKKKRKSSNKASIGEFIVIN